MSYSDVRVWWCDRPGCIAQRQGLIYDPGPPPGWERRRDTPPHGHLILQGFMLPNVDVCANCCRHEDSTRTYKDGRRVP
jgi:hypothetical protein